MSETLTSTLQDARAAFREALDYDPDILDSEDPPDDLIWETADACTPVYYSDLLDVASSNHDMILGQPDIGPAFDGTPTPINIITANIYEAIAEDLRDYWDELRAEQAAA